jgi:hypothetical protein
MSSSDSELNVTPEAVRLVTEGLNSELLLQKSKERYIGQFSHLSEDFTFISICISSYGELGKKTTTHDDFLYFYLIPLSFFSNL